MKITENFSLSEFTDSKIARKNKIINEPGSREKLAIINLCRKTLQPLREAANQPIHISSGYRCPALNRLVGGVPNSQHLKGEAADIYISGKAKYLYRVLSDSDIPFDQAILYRKKNMVHVSLKLQGEQRKEMFVAKEDIEE